MRIYELIGSKTLGVLLYYEKDKTFIIELDESLDEWSAPLMFAGLVKKGIYTIQRRDAFRWVNERIIPSGRQNIASILANHKLFEYDEMKMLELSGGVSSQDDIRIKKTDDLPDYVGKRMRQNLTDVFVSGDSLVCFFADESVKRVNLRDLNDDGANKVLSNRTLLQDCSLGAGGYYVTFRDSVDIPTGLLYEHGRKLPVTKEDFLAFVKHDVCDTKEVCNALGCSRQNVSYMVKQDMLPALKTDVKGNLFLKGDVLRSRW